MKNILVATDFSRHAFEAAVFAAELARLSGARLILFHAHHPAVLLEEETIWADPVILEKEVQEKIDLLAHELHQTYSISVTRLLKPGFPLDEIALVSHKIKADLVILGTRGAGTRVADGLGKVAAAILNQASFPVICLPPGASVSGSLHWTSLAENGWNNGNAAGLELLKKTLFPGPTETEFQVSIAG